MIMEMLAFCTLLATLGAVPRLISGPTGADRIAAAQLAGTGTVATLVLLGTANGVPGYFDIALVFAALSAVAGVAFVALRRRGS
ncbi:monovalent cation/H+ antiporter complex subunit F [Meridianimarinicoccus aquatilis]|uniref:pH regulation protein F n=1 Tax=Meridianimarinicoccus aquatilis TaxID=2552766 RepID=A0A4R6ATC0_9RHOB|nr:monovalent cation/H+ antiporter complex subunit F [Fluviibacterium aquatile]QIE43115.1 pH regulation protein F [Rhodobacteraceae bacterium SC52]TDL86915.1 pH regulation protein F [Fluviibacterium aquatile]